MFMLLNVWARFNAHDILMCIHSPNNVGLSSGIHLINYPATKPNRTHLTYVTIPVYLVNISTIAIAIVSALALGDN